MKKISFLILTILFNFHCIAQITSKNLLKEFDNLSKGEQDLLNLLYKGMDNYAGIEECRKANNYYATTVKRDNVIIVTIKMSDNDIFVFGFKDIYTKSKVGELVATNEVVGGYYNVKYGEKDKKTAAFYYITKKRAYPKNNIFTEEIWYNKVCFIIENRVTITKIIIGGKDVIPINYNELFPHILNK